MLLTNSQPRLKATSLKMSFLPRLLPQKTQMLLNRFDAAAAAALGSPPSTRNSSFSPFSSVCGCCCWCWCFPITAPTTSSSRTPTFMQTHGLTRGILLQMISTRMTSELRAGHTRQLLLIICNELGVSAWFRLIDRLGLAVALASGRGANEPGTRTFMTWKVRGNGLVCENWESKDWNGIAESGAAFGNREQSWLSNLLKSLMRTGNDPFPISGGDFPSLIRSAFCCFRNLVVAGLESEELCLSAFGFGK